MKHLITLGLLLLTATSAMAAPNSPAKRCGRYAYANTFQSTVAELCGGNSQSEFKEVLKDQSCEQIMGKEELKQQDTARADELRSEYNRIGAQNFCSKYGNRS